MNWIIAHLPAIGAALGITGSLYAFLKWIYGIAKKIDSTFAYVEALKSNHMPHLEHALRRICKKLDIDYDDVG